MDVKNVPIPLYSADFAWKLPYEVLPKNKVKLGVFLEELDEGVLVKSVKEYGNAANAGVEKGDVLLRLDGNTFTGVDDLVGRLQKVGLGGKAILSLRRADSEKDVVIIFQE